MALHPHVNLSPEIEIELRRVLDALPDPDLSALAQQDPAFQSGGFRAGNTAALRARALQLAAGSPPVSDALRGLLRTHSLNRPLVGLLSAATLTDLRHELALLFGGPRMLLAMLADAREEVRETAARWLRQEPVFLAMDPATATTHLHDTFARLLEAAGAGTSAAAVSVTRETWKDAREQLEQQLRDSRTEARRLKGVDDRLARLREQLTARDGELSAAQTRLVEAERQARTAVREREAATTELARELRYREERLLASVEARLATETAAWLAPMRAVAVEVSAAATSGDALLARAEEALARQAATDRHNGNRQILAARFAALTQALDKARDALANALHPLPELAMVESELAAETRRLGILLNRRPGRTPLEELLAARMALATSAELQSMRGVVAQLTAIGAFDAETAARLNEALANRLRLAYATSLPGAHEMDDDPTPPGVLRRALRGGCAAILLIDGHNVLFGLQGRYLPPQGVAVPTSAARNRLVEDVIRLAIDRPTCRAWVVFDGPTRSESTPAKNVRVTYSGGEGEHRADAALLDNIRFFRAGGDFPILLVTNDNALAGEARRLGANILSALEFSAFL
ncbi:MAG: hypothetical protein ACOYOU_04485 [Kiritimatiellia bacterium]